MKNLFFIIFASLMALSYTGNSQIINTIAGTGVNGFNGDHLQATATQLNLVHKVFYAPNGELYIADYGNSLVRKIDARGIITTIAGIGIDGFSGDGGAASLAQISPADITMDVAGNIYIADYANGAVRKINTAGIITTIAGKSPTPLGFSGDGGPATDAELGYVTGVAVDSHGNVYVVDDGNDRVRKISTSGIITNFAGNGTVGVDGDGGPSENAQLVLPLGVNVDHDDNVYISDYTNIRKVNSLGIISTIAGGTIAGYGGDGGPATAALLANTWHVAFDTRGDNMYIADGSNHRVRKVDSRGIITTVAGIDTFGFNGDGKAATNTMLYGPTGLAVDSNDNLIIVEYDNSRIRKLNVHFAPITGADSVCTTKTTLMGEATPGGVWSSSDPSIAKVDSLSGLVTGVSNGSVVIRYTIGSTTATYTVWVTSSSSCHLGFGNVGAPENLIAIAPNPAQNLLNISNAAGAAFAVYDLTGREVLSQKISTNQQIIDISGIEIGVYMIVLTDAQTGEKVVRRVVKE